MNTRETLKALESLGSAQTRKTYGRHGITGEMFGVKWGDLGKLKKRIKVDHELALGLWKSGNYDARILATMIMDPERITAKDLNAWIKDVDNHGLAGALSEVVALSAAGRKVMLKWMARKTEWPAATGWKSFTSVARMPDALTKDEARDYIAEIEARIHDSANAVRYAMNNALIAIGSHVPGMEREATQVAKRIGEVEVDHGDTSCKTPLAVPYIKKAAAHQRAMRKKAAAKKKATKR